MISSAGLNAASLLANTGFETPIVSGAGSGNWGTFSGSGPAEPTVGTVNPNSGSQHVNMTIAGNDNAFTGIQQNFDNIIVGNDYTFSFSALRSGALGLNAEFRIEWLDVGGAFVGGQFDNNQDITTSLTESYTLFSQTRTAPAGAVSGRAVIALQSFGAGDNNGIVFIDDADVDGVVIPEPVSYTHLTLPTILLV